jgi:hypothetical protein
VVPGLESLAQTPLPASVPFRVAPVPRPPRGRGQTAPLSSLLKGVFRDSPSSAPSRGGLSPPFMSPPPLSCPGVGFFTPSQGANDHLINIEVEAIVKCLEIFSVSGLLRWG